MDKLLLFLEIFGAIAGLIGVWLSTKQQVWCWPFLILSSIAYGIVFLHDSNALYADGTLQIIYIGMLVYGWNSWHKKTKSVLKTAYTSFKDGVILALLYIVLFFALAQFLQDYTKDPLPYLDSFTFVGSIAAQYLQARKKIENWLVWFGVNTVYIYMYYDRALYPTMVLFAIFWVMSMIGWWTWRKELRAER